MTDVCFPPEIKKTTVKVFPWTPEIMDTLRMLWDQDYATIREAIGGKLVEGKPWPSDNAIKKQLNKLGLQRPMLNRARLAQLAEHRSCNAEVGGSNPLTGRQPIEVQTTSEEVLPPPESWNDPESDPPAKMSNFIKPPGETCKDILALELTDCRWPYDDPETGGTLYCSKPAIQVRDAMGRIATLAYCEKHCSMAHAKKRPLVKAPYARWR